jgi:2-hydroxychromene-2-carboxylate isomerase
LASRRWTTLSSANSDRSGRAACGASARPGIEDTGKLSRAFAAAFYWIEQQDPAKAVAFAKAVYRRYWLEGSALSDVAVAADVAASIGCDRDAVSAGMQDARIKSRLIRENEEAIRNGVFGSPFFLVDGEPFWGSDRIAFLAQR